MKNYHVSLVIIAVFLSTGTCADDFRTFHDTTGREIVACLRSFNPQTNVVKIELKNKSVKTVKAYIFSENDQAYIHDWHMADALLSGTTLRLTANKKTILSDSYHEGRNGWHSVLPCMKFKDMNYEISLENRSGLSLNNIEIEYCIYHQYTIDETFMKTEAVEVDEDGDLVEDGEKGKVIGYRTLKTEKLPRRVVFNVTGGSWVIPEMIDKKKKEQKTKEIRLRRGSESKFEHEEMTRNTRKVNDELLGIRVRLYIPLKSGDKAMKEFSFPNNLVKTTTWVSPTD